LFPNFSTWPNQTPHEKYLTRREVFVNVNRPAVIIMSQEVLPQVQVLYLSGSGRITHVSKDTNLITITHFPFLTNSTMSYQIVTPNFT